MEIEIITDSLEDEVSISLEGKPIKVKASKVFEKKIFKYCRAKENRDKAEAFVQWMKDFRIADKVRVVPHDSGLFLIYKYKNMNYN